MSLYKQGKIYYCDFKDKKTGRRIRKSTGCSNKQEAYEFQRKLEEEIKAGVEESLSNINFEELSIAYINEALSLIKEKTQKDYIRYIKRFYEIIGNKIINDISREDIQKFVIYLKQKKLSPSSLRRHIFAVSAVFSYGTRTGLTEINPVRDFDKSYIPKENIRIRFLTKNEYSKLLDSCSYELLKKVVVLAVETGFRREELLSLKWEKHQVDFKNREISLWDTKNKEHRTIPISPTALEILKELYDNRNCEYVISLKKKRVKNFQRSFNTALKKANIEDFHWHDLRHTFATWALKGWFTWQKYPFDLYRLQKWLGHKDIKTTQRYAHLETRDLHILVDH
jgi:integrase